MLLGPPGMGVLWRLLCLGWLWMLLAPPISAQEVSPRVGEVVRNVAFATYKTTAGMELPFVFAVAETGITPAPVPRINVIAFPNPVNEGDNVTYTITYQNTGNSTATNVVVTDALSDRVQFISASDGGTFDPDTRLVTWTLDSLPPGQVETRFVEAQVIPLTAANEARRTELINNVAVLQSTEAQPVQASATTIVGSSPNLLIAHSVDPGVVPPGGELTYTVSLTNIGNLAANNTIVRNPLPAGTSYVEDSASIPAELVDDTLIFRLGDFDAGAQTQFTFRLRANLTTPVGTSLTNQPLVVADNFAESLANVTTAFVLTGGELGFEIQANTLEAYAGNPITYTLAVRNLSDSRLNQVRVRHPLPNSSEFESIDELGKFIDDEAVWTLDFLEPGQGTVFTWTVRTLPDTPAGAVIVAPAFARTGIFPEQQRSAATVILGRTPAQVGFFNADFNEEATAYFETDPFAYLQVIDLDRNEDPNLVETLRVVVTNQDPDFNANSDPDTVEVPVDREIVELTETGTDTGVFRGSIAFENIEASRTSNGRLLVAPDTPLFILYVDLSDEQPAETSRSRYAPIAVVFNSTTGEPVAGALVEFLTPDGLPAPTRFNESSTIVTDEDGKILVPEFSVPESGSRDLIIGLTLPDDSGLAYPSQVPNEFLPTETTTGKEVTIGPGSRGGVFTVTTEDPFFRFDLPVDPPIGSMRIEKRANKTNAAVGEIVTYEVTVTNLGSGVIGNAELVDRPPATFRYLPGSFTIDGQPAADPTILDDRTLRWSLGALTGNAEIEVTYKMMIGVDTRDGIYENEAHAEGFQQGELLVSNTSRVGVLVTPGIFTRNGIIVGKVFIDLNENRIQDENEPGQGEVTIYLEDGTYVITDARGKFSLANIRPGQHVLRIDQTTLPPDVEPVATSARHLDRANSQFIELSASGLAKANFVLRPLSASSRTRYVDMQTTPAPVELGSELEEEEDKMDLSMEGRVARLEDAITTMTSDLAFVNLIDGEQTTRRFTDIVVKFPLGTRIEVFVNDRPISEDRIGTRMEYPPGDVALREYISVPLERGRENLIEVRMKDNFGNVRGSELSRLYTVSLPDKIGVEAESYEAPADGRAEIPVTATVFDKSGEVVTFARFVNVEAYPAGVKEDDADPANPGHQLQLVDGKVNFTLVAPRQPGEVKLSVSSDFAESEVPFYFTPHLRDLLIVGSGDIVIGEGSTSGSRDELENIYDDDVKDGTYTDGRAAVFVKGRVTENVLLTATYDTSKARQDDFFNERDTDVDDESRQPIFGDESIRGYEAHSRDKLYIRADRNKSHAMYGDYYTEMGETRLTAYNRTFTGFKSEVNEGPVKVTGFAAENDQALIVDAIPANGTSGFYFLSRQLVVYGSERVYIETRDRQRPDLILERAQLTRQRDYDIQYLDGSILLRSPLPVYDEALNPNYLVVQYEVENGAGDHWAYGARAAYNPHENLTVGVTGAIEESDDGDYELLGADIDFALPFANTRVHAEVAQTDSVFSSINGLTPEDGLAWMAEFQSQPTPLLNLEGYIREVDEFFDNPSALDAFRGTFNYGAEGYYQFNDRIQLFAEAFKDNDELRDSEFYRLAAGGRMDLNQHKAGIELYQEHFSENFNPNNQQFDGPYGYETSRPQNSVLTSRTPFDNDSDLITQDLGLRLNWSTYFSDKLDLDLSHGQDLINLDQSLSYARLNYRFWENRTLYLIERYDRFEDRDELRTMAGFETPLGYNTTSFVEYSLEDTANATYLQQSVGLRNMFQWGEKVTGNATFEDLSTVDGESITAQPDGYAATVALGITPNDYWRINTRSEYRNDAEYESLLAQLGLVTKLSRDWSALSRVRYFNGDGSRGGKREDHRVSLGFAYRPIENDRLNAFFHAEWWDRSQDRQPGSLLYDDNKLLGAAEGIYQLTADSTIALKYAGKQYEEDGYSLYNDLYSARWLTQFGRRWEFGLTGRIMNEHEQGNTWVGGSIEVGVRTWKFIWTTIGYSFDDFDADLVGHDYSGEGVFLKLRFKFDENTLDDIMGDNADR